MRILAVLCVLLSAGLCRAAEGGYPWEELKALYREQIARELAPEVAPEPEPEPVAVVEYVHYDLELGRDRAGGTMELQGRVLSGTGAELPAFGAGLLLRDIEELTGADLLPVADGETRLRTNAGAETFSLRASIFATPSEGRGARVLTIVPPRALMVRLSIALADGLRLLEAPGIADAQGVYHLGAVTAPLVVRYARDTGPVQAEAPEIDLFTRVRVGQRRLFLETWGVPLRPIPPDTTLHLAGGSQFVASSLRPSALQQVDGDALVLHGGDDWREPFSVESVVVLPEDGAPLELRLPYVDKNIGREGRFSVRDPEDGQVTVSGEGLVSDLPVAQLGEGVPLGDDGTYMRVPSNGVVSLAVNRFRAGGGREIVLPYQAVYVSVDETGRSLTTLSLELPREAGPRLVLEPVADGEIWSLRVNDQARQVYSDADGAWVIPLDPGKPSQVELAVIREGEPLGLRGALTVTVPRTGLAARMLYVGVDLPDRVELLSVEGPVNTESNAAKEQPPMVASATYVFTQPFYKGTGVAIEVAYKEPVKQGTPQGSHERRTP